MSTVEHSTFTVERTYPAEPSAVFRAWSDPELKRRWFADTGTEQHELDFREGGTESSRGEFGTDGTKLTLTEHGAFLDGLDSVASREGGTASLLDKLGQQLGA